MTKVYPNAGSLCLDGSRVTAADGGSPTALTVWKKSLLFNCKGFTVFDGRGDLIFRVDNYMEGNRGEIVLMDATGKPLLTIRRKKLSLGDCWAVYNGEDTAASPRFSVRRQVNIRGGAKKSLAYACTTTTTTTGTNSRNNNVLLYEIEGSYSQRCCTVYDHRRAKVAEIKPKEAAVRGAAFGFDVFRLIIQPGQDAAVAMALVILLDQMFGSSKRFS